MSAEDDECRHGMWPATSCTICTKKVEKPHEPIEWFGEARKGGQCDECNLPIYTGQQIYVLEGRPTVHLHCSEYGVRR